MFAQLWLAAWLAGWSAAGWAGCTGCTGWARWAGLPGWADQISLGSIDFNDSPVAMATFGIKFQPVEDPSLTSGWLFGWLAGWLLAGLG